jgi:DNA polymerase V
MYLLLTEVRATKQQIAFVLLMESLKRMKVEKDCLYLMPENPNYPPIKVTEENELIIWGRRM